MSENQNQIAAVDAQAEPAPKPKMALCIATNGFRRLAFKQNNHIQFKSHHWREGVPEYLLPVRLEETDPFFSMTAWLEDRKIVDADGANTHQLQVLPYMLVINELGQWLMYRRPDKGHGEKKLRGNRSAGLGGHIEAAPDMANSFFNVVGQCAVRELEEETGITATMFSRQAYAFYDESNPVGTVHLCLLMAVFVRSDVALVEEENHVEKFEWVNPRELVNDKKRYDECESWTKIALDLHDTNQLKFIDRDRDTISIEDLGGSYAVCVGPDTGEFGNVRTDNGTLVLTGLAAELAATETAPASFAEVTAAVAPTVTTGDVTATSSGDLLYALDKPKAAFAFDKEIELPTPNVGKTEPPLTVMGSPGVTIRETNAHTYFDPNWKPAPELSEEEHAVAEAKAVRNILNGAQVCLQMPTGNISLAELMDKFKTRDLPIGSPVLRTALDLAIRAGNIMHFEQTDEKLVIVNGFGTQFKFEMDAVAIGHREPAEWDATDSEVTIAGALPLPDMFQQECTDWMKASFEPKYHTPQERITRFVEEAIELAQALGYRKEWITAQVEYVYDREPSDFKKELGDCSVTLHLLADSLGNSLHTLAREKLAEAKRPENMAKNTGNQHNKFRPQISPVVQVVEPEVIVEGATALQLHLPYNCRTAAIKEILEGAFIPEYTSKLREAFGLNLPLKASAQDEIFALSKALRQLGAEPPESVNNSVSPDIYVSVDKHALEKEDGVVRVPARHMFDKAGLTGYTEADVAAIITVHYLRAFVFAELHRAGHLSNVDGVLTYSSEYAEPADLSGLGLDEQKPGAWTDDNPVSPDPIPVLPEGDSYPLIAVSDETALMAARVALGEVVPDYPNFLRSKFGLVKSENIDEETLGLQEALKSFGVEFPTRSVQSIYEIAVSDNRYKGLVVTIPVVQLSSQWALPHQPSSFEKITYLMWLRTAVLNYMLRNGFASIGSGVLEYQTNPLEEVSHLAEEHRGDAVQYEAVAAEAETEIAASVSEEVVQQQANETEPLPYHVPGGFSMALGRILQGEPLRFPDALARVLFGRNYKQFTLEQTIASLENAVVQLGGHLIFGVEAKYSTTRIHLRESDVSWMFVLKGNEHQRKIGFLTMQVIVLLRDYRITRIVDGHLAFVDGEARLPYSLDHGDDVTPATAPNQGAEPEKESGDFDDEYPIQQVPYRGEDRKAVEEVHINLVVFMEKRVPNIAELIASRGWCIEGVSTCELKSAKYRNIPRGN